jgi:hypothetical protein
MRMITEELKGSVRSLLSGTVRAFVLDCGKPSLPGRRLELRPSEYETEILNHCPILVYTHEVGSFRILIYVSLPNVTISRRALNRLISSSV